MHLYEHQAEALEATKDLNHVAFYHDMGLGKTYTGAEKMHQLGGRVNLVICQKSKIDDWEEHFYLKVCGDSMKNIGMVDGSLALFRKQQYASDGDIVACLVGGDSATVKRFHRQGKNIYLMPENEDYQPIHLTTDDFESGDARILGVAVEVKIKL